MRALLKKHSLRIAVFITGGAVLVIEVLATRILAPHFGNTIFTVSSVLGVVLAALSTGYYAGGKLADRSPSERYFFGLIALSGGAVVLFQNIGSSALPALQGAFSVVEGPLALSLLLFFAPAFLLGMLSPYAVKLSAMRSPAEGIGSAAGTIFFWSTLGSIAGSLLAGFVLIPRFGTARIMLGTGVLLLLLGLAGLAPFLNGPRNRSARFFLLLLLTASALAAALTLLARPGANILYRADGVYERITIYDGVFSGRPARFLAQDRTASGAMFLDTDDPRDLVYDYTRYYTLYKVFAPHPKRALVIGGGAYSIPKALLAELPEVTVEVAEIEPGLFGLAKQFFRAAENPRLYPLTEDGRRFLAHSPIRYNLMVSDVYYSLYSVPIHFTTREFFALARQRLADGGLFIANVIGDLAAEPPSLIASEVKTFRSVFPNSYFFAADSPEQRAAQNIIFVGVNGTRAFDISTSSLAAFSDPLLRSIPARRIAPETLNLDVHPVLTDDFAPVEYLTAATLRRNSVR